MPYRDGHVVDWKVKIPNFGAIITNPYLSIGEKLMNLSKLIGNHPAFAGESFANQLWQASLSDDESDAETQGNVIIAEIYEYANDNLIWLGRV